MVSVMVPMVSVVSKVSVPSLWCQMVFVGSTVSVVPIVSMVSIIVSVVPGV